MKAKLILAAIALGLSVSTLLPQDTPKVIEAAPADDAAELAKKLSNPEAALINVPFQNNFDFGGGPKADGFQYKPNFEPVIMQVPDFVDRLWVYALYFQKFLGT